MNASGRAASPGIDRKDARRAVKKALEEKGLARGTKPHALTLPRCQRSGGVVEPMISTQWFVQDAGHGRAGARRRARRARPRSSPRSGRKTYDHFLSNIQDWCISRQLWWGHRIPAWHHPDGRDRGRARAPGGPRASEWTQDPDVLDTWFSSALWPFSTLGWPDDTAALAQVLPRERSRDGLRHPLLLGGPHDDVRAPLHGRVAVPARPALTGSSSTRPATR